MVAPHFLQVRASHQRSDAISLPPRSTSAEPRAMPLDQRSFRRSQVSRGSECCSRRFSDWRATHCHFSMMPPVLSFPDRDVTYGRRPPMRPFRETRSTWSQS